MHDDVFEWVMICFSYPTFSQGFCILGSNGPLRPKTGPFERQTNAKPKQIWITFGNQMKTTQCILKQWYTLILFACLLFIYYCLFWGKGFFECLHSKCLLVIVCCKTPVHINLLFCLLIYFNICSCLEVGGFFIQTFMVFQLEQ